MKGLKNQPKSGRGGKRPGAGRKRGGKNPATLIREEARKYLSERVRAEMEPLATAQLELAKGLMLLYAKHGDEWVHVTDPDVILKCLKSGEPFYRLVQKAPDAKALKDIFDREFGRPTETVQHEGSGGGVIQVKVIHEHRPSR